VFDGTKIDPYTEDDPAAPLGVYGQSKWEGDEAVRRLLPRHLILRVSWVFGIHGHNFVKTILRLAQEREELRVVADQHGCPTYAGDIADVLLELAGRVGEIDANNAWGIYHYCGGYLSLLRRASHHLARFRQRHCRKGGDGRKAESPHRDRYYYRRLSHPSRTPY